MQHFFLGAHLVPLDVQLYLKGFQPVAQLIAFLLVMLLLFFQEFLRFFVGLVQFLLEFLLLLSLRLLKVTSGHLVLDDVVLVLHGLELSVRGHL